MENKILKVEVLNVQEHVRKESAQDLYKILSDERSRENGVNYNWINNE